MGTGERSPVAHRELLRQKRILNDPRVADPDLSVETDPRLPGLPTKGERCREQREGHRHSDSPRVDCHGGRAFSVAVTLETDAYRSAARLGAVGIARSAQSDHALHGSPSSSTDGCASLQERPLTAIESPDMADVVEDRTKTLCKGAVACHAESGARQTVGNTAQAVSTGCFPRSSERPLADPPLGPLPGMRCGRGSRQRRPRPRPLRTVHRSSRSSIGCAGRPTRSASRRYGHLARAVLGCGSPIRGH